MRIQIDPHTLERSEERGATEEEIQATYFMGNGRHNMHVHYNDRTDLLYIRLDDRKQEVINKRVSEDVVLDIGEGERIIGIEVLDASKHVTLDRLLPVKYEISKGAV
jgi:uncharacterized protein YuzE